jgi:hypothetical protein
VSAPLGGDEKDHKVEDQGIGYTAATLQQVRDAQVYFHEHI